jgi:hypothetical protein
MNRNRNRNRYRKWSRYRYRYREWVQEMVKIQVKGIVA